MGKIFMIMGKSATGKDHIYRRLFDRGDLPVAPIVMYTTRPKRIGEENGREYFFTDEKHLEELRAQGRIIEERVYPTVMGNWYYFTADEGQFDLSSHSYLVIGTLEAYVAMKKYFGKETMEPLYVETDGGIRLRRSLKREAKQTEPRYAEICRRYLADEEDFSEEKLEQAEIRKRFRNNDEIELCTLRMAEYILENA